MFEKVENCGIQSGGKGFARERVKDRASIGVERKSKCWRERKKTKKGGNDLCFGFGKRFRSLHFILFLFGYSVDFAAGVGTAAFIIDVETDGEIAVQINAVIHIATGS